MSDDARKIVYCSGPMFSVADKWQQQQIAADLEQAGYLTYLPQRDGIEVAKLMSLVGNKVIEDLLSLTFMPIIRRAIFALDVYQVVERCDYLVFNMDGRDPDDGSVVEAAVGFAAGKPLVIYKTTPVTFISGEDNPMISGLAVEWTYATKLEEIRGKLNQAVAWAAAHGQGGYRGDTIPPLLGRYLAPGRIIWEFLVAWRRSHPQNPAPGHLDAEGYAGLLRDMLSHARDRGLFQPAP